MEHAFWHKTWADNEIGFHQIRHPSFSAGLLPDFDYRPGARIFVPLCGKSWICIGCWAKGLRLSAWNLWRQRVSEFFEEHGNCA